MKVQYYFSRLFNIFRQGIKYTKNASFPVAHYYSPIVGIDEYRKAKAAGFQKDELGDIDFRTNEQLELLSSFNSFQAEMPSWDGKDGNRYKLRNDWYPETDGIVLYSIVRKFNPKRVIEVGSGFSSACMLDVNDKFFDGKMEFTFIEPNPERLNDLLKSNDKSLAKIIVKNVQTVDLEEFKALEANDMLLIDSSHITKTGSDVNFLIFQVFPVLKPGVIIHIHDIFDGFEYPEKWIISGRSWNESYILRAFLQNNSGYEMLFFSDYLQQHHKEAFVSSIDPKRYLNGSAIYLRKK